MNDQGVYTIESDEIDIEFGSIMKCIHDMFPCEVYLKEIPEGFVFPSIYLPQPYHHDFNDTLNSYKVEYMLTMKVMGANSNESYNHASLIANEFRKKRKRFPLVDSEGKPTGHVVNLTRGIEVSRLDYGVHQVILSWATRHNYFNEVTVKMGYLDINTNLKEVSPSG